MLDNHKQAFIEEANELLAALESGLLELEVSPEDMDIVARVFRALHTIKGSGGMFGFDDIALFTHDIETIFDYVRNGQIPVTKELINLTLSAQDQISRMLMESNGEKHADDDKTRELVTSFRTIVLNYKAVTDTTELQPDGKGLCSEAKEMPGTKDMPGASYHIFFRPAGSIFLTGANPVLLIGELRQLGDCLVMLHPDSIPMLETIRPEECYSYWDIILNTSKGIDAIRDVFIFVEDDCQLVINVIDKNGSMDIEELRTYAEQSGKPYRSDISTLVQNFRAQAKSQKPIHEQKEKRKHKEEKHTEISELASSIRVKAEKLDSLVNLVGELVTVQARLTQTAVKSSDPELLLIAEEVERLTWELRDNALNIRMLPIGTTFSKFKRLVRDLTQELGKEVELVTSGAETELDKTVIERLNDPLVHIIRNCIDHGIEMPELREIAGKSRIGKVHLSASQSGGSVLIKVQDDGAGLNKESIRAKAISMGVITAEADLKDKEIFQLIFAAGFSTAKEVTSVSGRGVGMDVVRQAVDSLRGSVEIESSQGTGTTITLKLPLTLAIIDGLLVNIAEDFYILPLSSVEECIELTEADIKNTHGRHLVNIRGEIVPYISLRDTFEIKGSRPPIEQVVISNVGGTRIGFSVDSVIGSHQTVLKNLGKAFENVRGVSGATILGNGRVALILDIQKIMQDEEEMERNRTK